MPTPRRSKKTKTGTTTPRAAAARAKKAVVRARTAERAAARNLTVVSSGFTCRPIPTDAEIRRSVRLITGLKGHPAHHKLREVFIGGAVVFALFMVVSVEEDAILYKAKLEYASQSDLTTVVETSLTLSPLIASVHAGQDVVLTITGEPNALVHVELAGDDGGSLVPAESAAPRMVVRGFDVVLTGGTSAVRYRAAATVTDTSTAVLSAQCVTGCTAPATSSSLTVMP